MPVSFDVRPHNNSFIPMQHHPPCVSYFGETNQKTFLTILVIGREYNGIGDATSYAGPYDFKASPRSLFWNRAYCLVGRVTNQDRPLKYYSKKYGISPIIFGNMLPTSIPNGSQNKLAVRGNIGAISVNQHLNNIFSQDLVKRAEVIILSCGPQKAFEGGSATVLNWASDNKKALIKLPYLGSRIGNEEIYKCLSVKDIDSLTRVVSNFRGACSEA